MTSADTRPLETGWLTDTPVGDSLLRQYLFNQADEQTHLARAALGEGRSETTDEVALSDLDVPAVFLNQAVLFRPLRDETDPVLDTIATFFRNGSSGMLMSAWPTPDLTARGWQLFGHPMFVVRGPVTDDPGPPADVEIRDVSSAADLALVERLAVDGYPMPELADLPANAVFGAGLVGGEMAFRVGYLDGQPVGAAASHVGHDVVNLCFAATLPAARRRGVWQSLVAARCADAPHLPAAAITSDYSRPGFIRLGFLPISRFTLWGVPGR